MSGLFNDIVLSAGRGQGFGQIQAGNQVAWCDLQPTPKMLDGRLCQFGRLLDVGISSCQNSQGIVQGSRFRRLGDGFLKVLNQAGIRMAGGAETLPGSGQEKLMSDE